MIRKRTQFSSRVNASFGAFGNVFFEEGVPYADLCKEEQKQLSDLPKSVGQHALAELETLKLFEKCFPTPKKIRKQSRM